LRSVDRMRARVADVNPAELSLRLAVPRPRDEISRLATTLNAMLARLQAGRDAQRRFVADASHELRSPLATVTAALELARDRPGVIDRELVGAHLLPEAQRMQRLVEDLLLLAKADEQGLALRVTDLDLDDLVQVEADRLRASTTLLVTAQVQAVRVRGDEAQLARVVRNLVDNAARHARTRVQLSCRITPVGAQLVVATTARGSRCPSASGSCSVSSASTRAAPAPPGAAASAWPSSRRSSPRTTARSPSPTPRSVAPASWWTYPAPRRVTPRRSGCPAPR